MINIFLLICSVLFYATIWWFVSKKRHKAWTRKMFVKNILLITILCLPINFNDDIYTVMGNAINNKGSVYSVFSQFQMAEEGTFTFIGIANTQIAKRDEAFTLFGFSLFQKAKRNTNTLFGFSLYQKGENAMVSCGVSGYQDSEKNSIVIVGISGYQKSKGNAATCFGFSGFQGARETVIIVGIIGVQIAEKEAETCLGLTIFQKNKTTGEEKFFGFCSKI